MEELDKETITRCAAGEPKAQRMLYDHYAGRMFGVCLRYAKGEDDAKDIFQEAFVKVFRQVGAYSFKGSFSGWVRRIFVREALNFYRYDRTKFKGEDYEYELLPSEPLQISHLSTEELMSRIASLPDEQRVVFNLVEIEGYSYREAAELIGGNENSLRGVNFRAKKLLKKKLSRVDSDLKNKAV